MLCLLPPGPYFQEITMRDVVPVNFIKNIVVVHIKFSEHMGAIN